MDQATTEARIHICLLGRFEVRYRDTLVIDRSWNRGKAKALVKLLALQEGRVLHRERVLDLLWPDLDPGAAGSNLRKNLHYLRSTFAARAAAHPIVTATADMLVLSDTAHVDIDDFRAAARNARATRRDPELYEVALRQYAGDLLPEDIYQDWAAAPREELKALHRDLLAELAALYEAEGARNAAVDRLQQLLHVEPADEEAHRWLMRLYAEGGSRHRALRQFERCRDILDRELGLEPSAETADLHNQILEGRLRPPERSEGWRRGPTRLLGSLPPMYGREKELELANDALDAAADGRGGSLFVAGAAGIGKSHFAQHVLAAAEESGGLVLVGRSYELEASIAYQPVREMLRHVVDLVAGDAIGEAIQGSLYLKRLLLHTPLDTSPIADPALLQSELFEELARLFQILAARQLVVVCFENLHSADEASVRLLHVLCRRLASLRVAMVGTYRPEEVAADSPVAELVVSLRREGFAQVLTLDPLADGVMQLIVEEACGSQRVDFAFLRELIQLAEGNPLFAHELVHTLADEGWARLVDGRWERRESDPAPVPVAVREMVGRRLQRLANPSRVVIAAASVIGRGFDYQLLRRTVSLPEREVLDALDDAIGAFLLEETADGYRFRHELVREAVYRELTRARRQQVHRTVGLALAEDPGGEDAERVGYHFAHSDEKWRAVPHLQAAARKAASVFANEHAIALYGQALAIARAAPVDSPRLAELLEELGDLESRVGDASASVERLREALDIFMQSHDLESVLRVRGKAALGLVVLGRGEEAAELLGAHLEDWRQQVGQELGEQFSSFGVSAAYQVLADLRWHRGQHREAREAAEQAVLAAEASGDVRQRARAYESLALACHALGDWEQGVEYELSREALGVAGFESDIALDSHL